MKRLGKFHSWEAYSDNIAIKKCDKSVFVSSGTAVPIGIRWFFGIDALNLGEKVNIELLYENKKYKARISKESMKTARTRLFWMADLSKKFHSIYHHGMNYPSLKFKKLSSTLYEIEMIDLEKVNYDGNGNFRSEIYDKEGKKKLIYTTKYERNKKNREKAIVLHGTKCMICGFDFEEKYGEYGKDFIEVHHIKPLSNMKSEEVINPETDLVCVCPNCHRMIHRKRDSVLSIEELKKIIKNNSVK